MRRFTRPLFVALAALAAGCYPQSSMRWSHSGSVGVVAQKEKGVLVDGTTGEATPLPELVGWAPAVSPDGKHVLYASAKAFDDVGAALAALPKAQQDLVAQEAARVRAHVLAEAQGPKGPGGATRWPDLEPADLARSAVYCNLVLRAACRNADAALGSALAPGVLEKAKQRPVRVIQLVTAPVARPDAGRTLAASLYAITMPRLSPDGRLVAYLCHTLGDDKDAGTRYDLWVAPATGQGGGIRLARSVALGYAWRPDSRAIAYVASIGDAEPRLIGTLNTLEVADADGRLLAKAAEPGGDADRVASAEPDQRAGVIFSNNATAVYLPSGRLLFASVKVSLPLGHLEGDPQHSIFAYDPATGAVADILPPAVSQRIAGQAYFDLSPDGKRVLVPLGKQGFLVYTLGEAEASSPLADEAAVESAPPPAWKGPDHVVCTVGSASSLLKDTDGVGGNEKALVEVDREGNRVRVLPLP